MALREQLKREEGMGIRRIPEAGKMRIEKSCGFPLGVCDSRSLLDLKNWWRSPHRATNLGFSIPSDFQNAFDDALDDGFKRTPVNSRASLIKRGLHGIQNDLELFSASPCTATNAVQCLNKIRDDRDQGNDNFQQFDVFHTILT